MFFQTIQAGPPTTSGSVLKQLNAAAFTALQFQGALESLAQLPGRAQSDPRAQTVALQAYASDTLASDEPIVSAALHARVTALAHWTATHDPDRGSNAEAVMEAAARFPLSDIETGIGFEPAGFQEMILFIEELPW